MATVEISFIAPVDANGPIDAAYPESSEFITSSASNQTSTGAAISSRGAVVVVASGGAVKVSIGAAPNATSDSNLRLIPDGATRAFGGVRIGHKVAVVDA